MKTLNLARVKQATVIVLIQIIKTTFRASSAHLGPTTKVIHVIAQSVLLENSCPFT